VKYEIRLRGSVSSEMASLLTVRFTNKRVNLASPRRFLVHAGNLKGGSWGGISLFTAQALMAIVVISQAITKAVKPIPTVKVNIASSS